jgi:hypothetical protein
MADPCVADSAYIGLDTAGSPAVLTATLRNPENTYSGTDGDDTVHNVNDTGVVHTLTHTYAISNAGGSAAMVGIVVWATNPIWCHGTDDVTLVPFARLTVNGSVADERDVATTGIDIPGGTTQLLSLGALVGQINIPAGASHNVEVLQTLENIGASGQWSFRFGGFKMVIQEGF